MKNAVIGLVLLLVLGAGGYLYLNSRGMVPKVPGAMVGNNTAKGGGVFTSIKDALSKSVSLKCVYKDEQGVETTSYIKNGAVRVMMAGSTDVQQPNNIIMKDMKMNMWSDTTKEGILLTIDTPTDVTPPEVPPGTELSEDNKGAGQQESILATIEKYKDACKPEVVADSMFTVPTDVKFQDMSALQKEMMKGLPQAPQGEGDSQDYQKYLEEVMKQQGGQ
jgi:hypothetical protein